MPKSESPRLGSTKSIYLVTKVDNGYGEVHTFSRQQRIKLGRAPTNQIVLRDDLCSREHAEIFFKEGNWYLSDLGSLNGSRVNNETIREREYSITEGDEIQIGRTKFLFTESIQSLPRLPKPPDTPKPQENRATVEIKQRLRTTRFTPSLKKNKSSTVDEHTVSESNRLEQVLDLLYRMALDMGSANNLEELTSVVLETIMDGVPAELTAITQIIDGKDQQLLAHRFRDEKKTSYYKFSHLVSHEVIQNREAVLAKNLHQDPQYNGRDSINDLKASSLICAPIVYENDLKGLLHIYSSQNSNQFEQDDLEFALAIARHFALVWHQLERQDRLQVVNRELKDSLRLESELVGSSDLLKQIEGQISRVAATTATVLIRGESGSGKELVARAIHFSSPRRDAPYVCLNCAALTETLLESELFGHEKGAYTGATEKMIGKFEAADHGTIFLDEIGEMPLTTQAKFLRVLEGHPFERLGGNNQIRVDVRVVAATNQPLEEAVRSGQFRKDLFFRLQVVEIRVPPLRERLSDIEELANHFLKKFVRETGRKIRGFTSEAISKLQSHSWPGNVRELRNVIERAVALSTNSILDSTDIWLAANDLLGSGVHKTLELVSLVEIEKRHIRAILNHTQWNKSQTAEILGIERSTLDRKIDKYEIKKSSS